MPKISKKSVRTVAVVVIALATTALGSQVAIAAPTVPYTQCPHIANSPSCGVLIVLNPDGTASILGDPNVGPYDGGDDTLVGVQNNTSAKISHLTLSSSTQDIFGFEGDGICEYQANSGCGATGYEGPNTAFTIRDASHGDVVFPAGLVAGQSTYFSLEERLDAASFVLPVGAASSTPLMLNGNMPAGSAAAAGAGSASQNSSPVPNVLPAVLPVSATVLRSTATIDAGSAVSTASVHSLNVATAVSLIGLHSTAASSCASLPVGGGGVTSGFIGTQQIPASTPPNTVYMVGALRVVINEQLPMVNGITVNAVHITGPNLDLIVGSSTAKTQNC